MSSRIPVKGGRQLPARPPVTKVIEKAEQAAESVVKALEKLRAKQQKRLALADSAAPAPFVPRLHSNSVSSFDNTDILPDECVASVPIIPLKNAGFGNFTRMDITAIGVTKSTNVEGTRRGSPYSDENLFSGPAVAASGTVHGPTPVRQIPASRRHIAPEGDDLLTASVIQAVEDIASPLPRIDLKIQPRAIASHPVSVSGVPAACSSDTIHEFDESLSPMHAINPPTKAPQLMKCGERTTPNLPSPLLRAKSPVAKGRATTLAAHRIKLTGKALKASVNEMKQDYRKFRAEASAILSHSMQAIDCASERIRRHLGTLQSQGQQGTAHAYILQLPAARSQYVNTCAQIRN
jgi:hypothetical protein